MRSWQKDHPNISFEQLVSRYINHCLEYLSQKDSKARIYTQETENRELIYYKLRDLKDSCMKIAGKEPLDWMG